MEITLEGIIALITLFVGGSGIGGLVTWRWLKKKAKAEADQAAAEAKQKEVEDNHRLIAELREDRDHYKKGYVEMRDEVDKLTKEFYDFKRDTMKEREKMKLDISRNTRIAESSRPFMCGLAPNCAKCVPVIISDEGTVKPNEEKHEIEPNNEE